MRQLVIGVCLCAIGFYTVFTIFGIPMPIPRTVVIILR